MRNYNKLVRDKIPDLFEKDGYDCDVEALQSDRYLVALNLKLQEELQEYNESGEVIELADLVEVIYAIAALKGVSIEEFDKMRLAKKEKKGGFGKRLFLKKVVMGVDMYGFLFKKTRRVVLDTEESESAPFLSWGFKL